jgi:vanillate O-demethylase monooxygenase subunit
MMMPESEMASRDSPGMARDFEVRDRGLTCRIKHAQSAVFAEDIVMLDAQQESILRRPDRELRDLHIDAGGMRARRLIERELAKQVAQSAAAPTEAPAA